MPQVAPGVVRGAVQEEQHGSSDAKYLSGMISIKLGQQVVTELLRTCHAA